MLTRCRYIPPLPILAIAYVSTAASAAPDAAAVFAATAPSVVTVEAGTAAGTSQGSGVVVAPGLVVTNSHVVAGAGAFVVVRQGARGWRAEVDATDPDRDLALLSIVTKRNERFDLPVARRRTFAGLKVGERVYAIGSPRGLEQTLSDGLVSGKLPLTESISLLQTTAAISPGSSGGGLFDEKGMLVGITTLYLKESQSLNFAVPADYVADLERTLKPPSSVDAALTPPPPATPAKAAPAAATSPPHAAATPLLPVPLGRVKAVVLRASADGPVADDGGLSEAWILARAAATLRNAGLAVYATQEGATKAGKVAPTMVVGLSSMHIDSTVLFPWALRVDVSDDAQFADGRARQVTIWTTSTYGYGGSDVVSGQVARAIDQVVEQFVNEVQLQRGPAPVSN